MWGVSTWLEEFKIIWSVIQVQIDWFAFHIDCYSLQWQGFLLSFVACVADVSEMVKLNAHNTDAVDMQLVESRMEKEHVFVKMGTSYNQTGKIA